MSSATESSSSPRLSHFTLPLVHLNGDLYRVERDNFDRDTYLLKVNQ